jgi:hypothetical protein
MALEFGKTVTEDVGEKFLESRLWAARRGGGGGGGGGDGDDDDFFVFLCIFILWVVSEQAGPTELERLWKGMVVAKFWYQAFFCRD